ncbi:hypothetical protein BGX38DRAFT_1226622 [Terfezia claveryi]|nr:hypothetical protein BGX38DRAFT_1226622 [Terfezia claveryi]
MADIADPVHSSDETLPTAFAGGKQPDVIFSTYELNHYNVLKALPKIVVEVGLSESYTDLLTDARHWLEQTSDSVQIVFLVKIYENPHDFQQHRHEAQLPTTTSGLADQAEFSDKFSGGSYKEQENYFRSSEELCNKYAGNLSGFVEVWRYSHQEGGMYQAGPRIDLLPHLSSSRTLIIDRRDLNLPYAKRGNRYKVDLARLARCIERLGKYRLAHWRWQKIMGIRRRWRERNLVQIFEDEHDSGDYATDLNCDTDEDEPAN